MAQKEATVYILDLGRSMGEKRNGRSQTNLEWALEYVWDKITTTVATGRKTAMMGVVGYRTDETDVMGAIDDDDGYSNTRIIVPLKQLLLPDIRDLQPQLKPSATNQGDVLSALAVAIQMIDTATTGKTGKPLKYDRRINIITDGYGHMETSDSDAIAAKLKEDEVEMNILGVDFDDAEFGFKEEDKDPEKEQNETTLKDFARKCNGNFATIAEAISQLEIPRTKNTHPVPSYKGTLTLGDSENYDTTLTIDVERYPCTMIAKPPTASSFVVRTDLSGGAGASTQSSATVAGDEHRGDGQLAAVKSQRVYQIDNLDEPGTKTNVEMEDLERGFEYGRTAVHISESDANVVKLETSPCLDLIGFVPEEKFERYLPMSRTNYVVPQRTNTAAALALSSLIHALYESGCYALARLVTRENKAPLLVLLVPRIEPDLECLVDVELPFAEDMRRYKFPPLDKHLTVSGKVITEHRDLPNTQLMQAMNEYVDAMDLSSFDRDDEGEPTEYMKFEDTYSPLLHRINHIIRWRATHPTSPSLPAPPQILTKYSAPPPSLLDRASPQLAALKAAADVKKVPPKQQGRGKRTLRDREKPLSGLDVDALLGNPKRVKIDSTNLIPSFKQALAATDDLEAIQTAAADMARNIREYISTSVGESGYGRALEAIRVMREEITELEEPEIYNSFVRDLKRDLLEGRLRGDRREMWWKIRGSKYGLVERKTCFASEVSEEEAAEFYRSA
ncbi:SPOC domain-like protein [Lindgomyces ingoldianus]|uniref:SPOC domain-like protein n=1 Tax=Lindgomyces ingoldianus TaxID=673940 RepID=A0ACB6RC47_9PLEO|nr:SPOC domain-like protein [Lindgomyces ingoldianus]KAF2476883.1 SPOC domain-like protein [Lindgomyces ingoldianus]